MRIHCRIYRSTRRDEMYLYVPAESELDEVPEELLSRMGRLEFVMDLELHPGRKLARANVAAVLASLESRGYFLQMPPVRSPEGAHGAG